MKKTLTRLALSLGAVGAVVAGSAMFAAFEAKIVGVSARIEDALSVDTQALDFGTVFPQEYFTRDINITLSDSFSDEDRVDDVEYVIKQKPKVKLLEDVQDPNANPKPGDPNLQITVGNFTGPAWQYCEENLPADSNTTDNIGYTVNLESPYWDYCYLPLANSLSKHETTTDGTESENDKSIDAFHKAYLWAAGKSSLDPQFIATGRLAKSVQDTTDTWVIDLKVPCFYGRCAQEADDVNNLVDDATPGFNVPVEFRLDPATEHKVFGTDLWIEVTEISETSTTPPPPPPTTSLTVTKVVQNDSGGTAGVVDFPLQINGNAVVSGVANSLPAGNYTVTETNNLGYTATFSGACNAQGQVTLASGQQLVCTITNNDPVVTPPPPPPPATGTLTITKTVVDEGNLDDAVAGDFNFSVNGSGNFTQGSQVVPAGQHTVAELNPQGYTVTYGGDCNAQGQITVPADGTATCSVTNTLPFGTITVVKQVTNNNGGTAVVGDFQLFVNAAQVTHNTSKAFAPGTYTISETGVSGYAATFSGDCDANSHQITLAAGDNKTCTITNDDIAPIVTLTKNVSGGSALPNQFLMRIDGAPVPTGSSVAVTANANHQITEDAFPGYSFQSLTGAGCPAALSTNFSLLPGQSISCTITNSLNS